MELVPIQSNSDAYTQAMDEHRHYHYHEHHHHHHYHREHNDQNHDSEIYSKPNNEVFIDQNPPKPTYQVYCRAGYNFALTIQGGTVILAPSNPSDPRQHWYKEDKFKTQVKDAIGLPSFALVNKATGQAIKHPTAAAQPMKLIQYKPEELDHSVLWCEAAIKDDNGDYKAIRMVNNVRLNWDAFNGIHDGTIVGVYDWNGGNPQRWNILSY